VQRGWFFRPARPVIVLYREEAGKGENPDKPAPHSLSALFLLMTFGHLGREDPLLLWGLRRPAGRSRPRRAKLARGAPCSLLLLDTLFPATAHYYVGKAGHDVQQANVGIPRR